MYSLDMFFCLRRASWLFLSLSVSEIISLFSYIFQLMLCKWFFVLFIINYYFLIGIFIFSSNFKRFSPSSSSAAAIKNKSKYYDKFLNSHNTRRLAFIIYIGQNIDILSAPIQIQKVLSLSLVFFCYVKSIMHFSYIFYLRHAFQLNHWHHNYFIYLFIISFPPAFDSQQPITGQLLHCRGREPANHSAGTCKQIEAWTWSV